MTKDASESESLQPILLLPVLKLVAVNSMQEALIAQMSDAMLWPTYISRLNELNEEILMTGWLNASEMLVRANFMLLLIGGTIMDGWQSSLWKTS